MIYEQDAEKERLYTTEKYIFEVNEEDEVSSIRMRKRGLMIGFYYFILCLVHLPFMFLGMTVEYKSWYPIYRFFLSFNLEICITFFILFMQSIFLIVVHMVPKLSVHITKWMRLLPIGLTLFILVMETLVFAFKFARDKLPGHAIMITLFNAVFLIFPDVCLFVYMLRIQEKK